MHRLYLSKQSLSGLYLKLIEVIDLLCPIKKIKIDEA